MTRQLYERIEHDGRIHTVTSKVTTPDGEEVYFIRIAIVYRFTDEEICHHAYGVISELTAELMPKKNGYKNGFLLPIANGKT